MQKSDVIKEICTLLIAGDEEKASKLIRQEYPFQYQKKQHRKINQIQTLKLYLRDGFIDRYSGERLVFPGMLRLLSKIMPEEFPYHPNWKMSECHFAYWELMPTIDHVKPVARGGADDETNWVTTSMLRNSAKANWTLEELGWNLVPPGDLKDWDGLTGNYLQLIESSLNHLQDKTLLKYYNLIKNILPKLATK